MSYKGIRVPWSSWRRTFQGQEKYLCLRFQGLIDMATAEIITQENGAEKGKESPSWAVTRDERPFYLLACSPW